MKLQGSEIPILIVLAGGKSSRMGTPKGLLPYKNTCWILEQIQRYTIENAFVYIGLGFDSDLYFKAIPWLEKAVKKPQVFQGKCVQVVINKQANLGTFSTLQSVLKQVKQQQDILVLPIDVPLLNSVALHKIMGIRSKVVIPNCKGKNGHPVKLSYNLWKTFLTLHPFDAKSRLDIQIKQRATSEISIVKVEDCAILKNLNTPENWEMFVNQKS